jgi:putative membrane protein
MMGWYDWDHMGGWVWVATTLGSLLLLGLLGLVAWLVIRAVRGPVGGPTGPARTAGQDTAERLLAATGSPVARSTRRSTAGGCPR